MSKNKYKMWCLINEKTGKIVPINVSYFVREFVIGFTTKKAILAEVDHAYTKSFHKIKQIEFEY